MASRWAKIFEAALIFLIVFTPLAFGGVHFWSTTLVETVILSLLIVLFFGVLRKDRAQIKGVPLSIILAGGLFLILVVLQLMPLPARLISYISPSTSHLYERTLAGEE